MVRWYAGSVIAPVFHNVSGGVYLSVRSSLTAFLGDGVARFERVFRSILCLGVPIPAVQTTSVLEALNKSAPPAVAAVNGQWRQLLAAVDEITMAGSTCVQFKAASLEQLEAVLVLPDKQRGFVEIVSHGKCGICATERCPFSDGGSAASLLETYRTTFFQPISGLLEIAVKKTWGIQSSFLNPQSSAPRQPPGSMSIEEFMKSGS
jgi:hypothetical protein